MDSANQIQALVNEVEKNPEYKISEQEAKGFLSEIKRLTKEDKTNMPPLVVIIMAYINMLFPELDEVKVWGKSKKNKINFSSLLTYKLGLYLPLIPLQTMCILSGSNAVAFKLDISQAVLYQQVLS